MGRRDTPHGYTRKFLTLCSWSTLIVLEGGLDFNLSRSNQWKDLISRRL